MFPYNTVRVAFSWSNSKIFSSHCPTCLTSVRWIKKFTRIEDPEVTKRIPVMEYVGEKSELKRSKHVYSWGLAVTGALGNPNFLQPTPTGNKKHDKKLWRWQPLEQFSKPQKIRAVDDFSIKDVAAGYGFTIIAATNKDKTASVYGCGLNSDSQLGYQEYQGKSLVMVVKPLPINLRLRHKDQVVSVAAGRSHSFFLTKNSKVFSLGNNSFGQCGVPIIEGQIYSASHVVNEVNIPEKVVDIVCGQDHTFFLTENGSLYSCGLSTDGQTGLGHFGCVGVPQKLSGDLEGVKIIQVASISDGALALSDTGDVFGWGNSEYNQLLSVTDQLQLNTPRRLPLNNIGKVIRVAAGGTACAVLNDKNQIYVWGFGILGKGPLNESIRNPSLIPETIFGCNDFNPDLKVVDIAAGLRHFAVITNEGDLFMWGKNRNGCLGFEGRRRHLVVHDQLFPLRVDIPVVVKKVSLGVDHTVALATNI